MLTNDDLERLFTFSGLYGENAGVITDEQVQIIAHGLGAIVDGVYSSQYDRVVMIEMLRIARGKVVKDDRRAQMEQRIREFRADNPAKPNIQSVGPAGRQGAQGAYYLYLYRIDAENASPAPPAGVRVNPVSATASPLPAGWSLTARTPGPNQALFISETFVNPAEMPSEYLAIFSDVYEAGAAIDLRPYARTTAVNQLIQTHADIVEGQGHITISERQRIAAAAQVGQITSAIEQHDIDKNHPATDDYYSRTCLLYTSPSPRDS